MVRKYAALLLTVLFLGGCGGGAPKSPHIYVVGVDLTRSFWQTGVTSLKRPAELSASKVQELAFKIRQRVDEINAIVEDPGFIRRTKREGGSDFYKEIDVATIRAKIDDAIVMSTVLQKNTADAAERLNIAEKVQNDINTLAVTIGKCNFIKTTRNPKFDESVNPESEKRIRKLADQIETLVGSFSYTTSISNQPKVLRETGDDVMQLTTFINQELAALGHRGMDPKWNNRGVYGKVRSLAYGMNFKIGSKLTTAFQPTVKDLNESVEQMVKNGVNSGTKVFYAATDYGTFFQRSLREIENLMNDWGDFDRDIGIQLTFIIIGDGKHDAEGKHENLDTYDMDLITEIRDLFIKENQEDALLGGIPWNDINKVNIKFCTPQRRYNTDILDQWTKLLQEKSGSKISVRYYMFENLKEGGPNFSRSAINNLIDF